MLSPILENLTKDTSIKTGSGSSLNLVTVDTDQQVELGQKYQVCLQLHSLDLTNCPL